MKLKSTQNTQNQQKKELSVSSIFTKKSFIKLRSISKVLISVSLIGLLSFSLFGCGSQESTNTNQGVSQSTFVLDTICSITIYGLDNSGERYGFADEDALEEYMGEIIQYAFKQLEAYDNMLSATKEGSQIWNINHAKGKPVKVNETTINLLKKSIEYAELSGGLFDITCGGETALWDFRGNSDSENPILPDAADIEEAVKHVDYKNIIIDEENMTVQLKDSAASIDLGGIAKGYISDRMGVFLEDCHVKSAIIDLGGNIVLVNGKSAQKLIDVEHEGLDFDDFNVGVTDPDDTSDILGTVALDNKSIVTSGTYERCFTVDGVTYHHILDPKTGYPVDTDISQVTIIGGRNKAIDCDALSTICLMLGKDKALELINTIDKIEAIVVDTNGKVYYTDDSAYKLNKR